MDSSPSPLLKVLFVCLGTRTLFVIASFVRPHENEPNKPQTISPAAQAATETFGHKPPPELIHP